MISLIVLSLFAAGYVGYRLGRRDAMYRRLPY